MTRQVEIDCCPEHGDVDAVLAAWQAIFPEPGAYTVDYLAKADVIPTAGEGPFETWFLQALEEVATRHFESAQQAIWEVLDELLARARVRAPSDLDLWELNRTLFDLTGASTARMVGIHVPDDVLERLHRIGFQPQDVLDFPALAYRMGRLYQELSGGQPMLPTMAWQRVVDLARSKPVAPAEELAIQHLRRRAGIYLTPTVDSSGRVWTAEREILPLRRLTSRVVDDRIALREAARELGNSQRAIGIRRDAQRVVRTEIAEARSRGAWATDALTTDAETLMYRVVSTSPCKTCLRLYLLPDGTPRPYKRRDLEAMSAQPNRGPAANWTAKIGSTHPACCCGIWQVYQPEYRRLWQHRAADNRELLRRLKVYDYEVAA